MVSDALESTETAESAAVVDVEQVLGAAIKFAWMPYDSVGDGTESRTESPSGDHASVLTLDGVVVHGSIMLAV